MNETIQILVVDDQRVVRRAITRLLSVEPDFEIIGEAVDGLDALRKVERLSPDVVLMDVSMPKLNGLEATRRIAAQFPNVRVVAFSMHDAEPMARRMLEAGAVTYLDKGMPAETLAMAIRLAGQDRVASD